MTTKSRKKPAGKPANSGAQQPAKSKKQPFVSRYIGIDAHLTERNGSTEQVYGIAAERPAGRKLADDIARVCVQLDAEGYDVISIFPLTSGRAVEATVKYGIGVPGWTHYEDADGRTLTESPVSLYRDHKRYIDTGVGYSVTDGVVITARLRQ